MSTKAGYYNGRLTPITKKVTMYPSLWERIKLLFTGELDVDVTISAYGQDDSVKVLNDVFVFASDEDIRERQELCARYRAGWRSVNVTDNDVLANGGFVFPDYPVGLVPRPHAPYAEYPTFPARPVDPRVLRGQKPL